MNIETSYLIDVSGVDGKNNKPYYGTKAQSANNLNPGNGSKGQDGIPGLPGGNVYIKTKNFTGLNYL